MERNIKRNGLINLLLLVVVAGVTYAIARYGATSAGQVAAVFLGLGVLVAAVSWFQMGIEERERLERMEFDEATRTDKSGLFNTAGSEAFPAQRSREQFERFFVPAFTLVLFFLEAAGAWYFWGWLGRQIPASGLNQPLVVLGVVALMGLILFVPGRFAANLTKLEKQRLLGPGASWLLLGAFLLWAVAAGIIAVLAGFAKADLLLAYALCGVLGLLAVESAVGLILEIYRPRVKGRQERLLYDSRLVGLLGHPEDIFTTAAHTLDYQFGFKVSETWFYKFLEKAFLWLVLIQVGLLWLSSCFVVVTAGEEALHERFGRPVGDGVLKPGLHFKLPWPMDSVHRFRRLEVQTFEIGAAVKSPSVEDDGHGHEAKEEGHHAEKLVLWSVEHTGAGEQVFNMLVASRESGATNVTGAGEGRRIPPVNLLTVRVPVQYQISDLRAWAYNHQNPADLLERIGASEATYFLASADLQEILSTRRIEAGEELRDRIQKHADRMNLGVKILFLGFYHTHPPIEVAASFEAAVGAQQIRAAEILKADAYKVQTNLLAQSEAIRLEREAEAARYRLVAGAMAREAMFSNQVAAWQASPAVYAQRAYLQALSEGGAQARKYILSVTNSQDVIILNLEEKFRPDILDIPVPVKAAK